MNGGSDGDGRSTWDDSNPGESHGDNGREIGDDDDGGDTDIMKTIGIYTGLKKDHKIAIS